MTSLCLATQSLAAVLPIFTTTPDNITAGTQSVLDLQLNLSADPNFFNAQFTGGTVTLFSGDGGSTSFGIGSGGTSRHFSFAFTYPDVGNYFPSFSVTASYTQDYIKEVYLYDFPQTVFAGNSCTLWTCTPTYTTKLIPVYGPKTFTTSQNVALSGEDSLVITPLPAALPLYATGLGVIALLTCRRKRRAAARAASEVIEPRTIVV
jgi:hypothetical protein